jgi:hypothetical protein
MENSVESMVQWTTGGAGPRWTAAGPRMRLAGERSERHTRVWNLAAVEEKGLENSGEPHRLQEGAAEGRKWPGVGGENRRRRRSVRAVLGRGEKRREVGRGPVKPEVGALPFIGAGEGHAGARRGETADGNGLNAIDGMQLNEGSRGGLKRGSRRGVKTSHGISRLEAR